MPGFLGDEKQFHTKFGKKIMASRDPKASTKDREQGVLAMEALHRQVWFGWVLQYFVVSTLLNCNFTYFIQRLSFIHGNWLSFLFFYWLSFTNYLLLNIFLSRCIHPILTGVAFHSATSQESSVAWSSTENRSRLLLRFISATISAVRRFCANQRRKETSRQNG